TVCTGLIAEHFGPAVGGLFLAFPAILPASASLIAAHEARRKRRAGQHGTRLGRRAAGLAAAGATLGSVALMAFALTAWWQLSLRRPAAALLAALAVWSVVAPLLWWLARRRHRLTSQAAHP